VSTAKHSPAPWVWSGEPGASDLVAAGGNVFSHAYYENIWPGCYDERDAANMQLIAAAPDMKAALVKLAMRADEQGDIWAREIAAAAIDKADGR